MSTSWRIWLWLIDPRSHDSAGVRDRFILYSSFIHKYPLKCEKSIYNYSKEPSVALRWLNGEGWEWCHFNLEQRFWCNVTLFFPSPVRFPCIWRFISKKSILHLKVKDVWRANRSANQRPCWVRGQNGDMPKRRHTKTATDQNGNHDLLSLNQTALTIASKLRPLIKAK